MKSSTVWRSRILLTGLLLSGAAVLAPPLTVYVDVNAPAGGTGGATDPYQTIGAAVTFLNGSVGAGGFAGTVKVADGVYRASTNGGLENFGADGITLTRGMDIKGGYAGGGDWTDASRVLRSSDIDLTLANTRAFYEAGVHGTYQTSLIDGFTIRNGNVTRFSLDVNGNPYPSGDGGAIGMSGGWGVGLKVANSALLNNYANRSGGAVYATGTDAPAEVRNSLLSGNQAGTNGGGAFISDAYNTNAGVFDSVLIGNTAASGGGVYLAPPSGAYTIQKAERNIFLNNVATGNGGALFSDNSEGAGATLINQSQFLGNSAPKGAAIGGSAYWQGAYDIRNSLIAWNTGGYAVEDSGAARIGNYYNMDLSYVTVANNPAGGVWVNWSGGGDLGLRIRDSIIANNDTSGVYYVKGSGPASIIQYSDVYGQGLTTNFGGDAFAGTGTISADPLFIDPSTNNYMLPLFGSQARGSAIDIGIYFDLVGTARPQWYFDMGALQSIPEPATMSLLALGALPLLRRRRR